MKGPFDWCKKTKPISNGHMHHAKKQSYTIQKKMLIVSYAFWQYESAAKVNIGTIKLNPIENKRQIANRRFNGI